MKLLSSATLLLSCIFFYACTPSDTVHTENQTPIPTRQQEVEKTAVEFFHTFAERKDWDKMLSFYREDMRFRDITLQLELDSLWQFKRFYDWPAPGFKKLSDDQQHLTVESLLANDSVAVARGHFNPFHFHGELIKPAWGMDFTIWLYFDQDLKITQQIDWIEYDLPVMESMVNRIKTDGHEKTPEWLDLSRD